MSKFSDALVNKDFVTVARLDPPKGVDLSALVQLGKELAGRVDALLVSDNRGARVTMGPLLPAMRLASEAGAEVIMAVSCRDRNRLALTSQLLAAASAGIENLLLVSGDHATLGDHAAAKGVHDLDSVQALGLASGLAAGHDLAGNPIDPAPSWCLGGAVAAGAATPGPYLMKARKKVEAGASFLVALPVADAGAFQGFAGGAGDLPASILASVEAGGEGVGAAAKLVSELRAAGAKGIVLGMEQQELLPQLLDACQL